MKKYKFNKLLFCRIFYFFSIFLLTFFLSGFSFFNKLEGLINQVQQKISDQSTSVSSDSNENQGETLGQSTIPSIYISGKSGYPYSGVIALSSNEEPSIRISSREATGMVELDIYQANKENLLDYLKYDAKGTQINRILNTKDLEPQGSFEVEIKEKYGKGTDVSLPLEGVGIWYLKIHLNGVEESAMIVRSSIGAVLKEGDNNFVFWGQDLNSKRSLNSGQIELYNLKNNPDLVSSGDLSGEGISQLPVSSLVDVAFLIKDDEFALIPVNMRYSIRGEDDKYSFFKEKEKQTKFFVFTDRPLYKPGDTIYFKAIIRDDDDVRYTIPSDNALLKIYNNSFQDKPILERYYPITSEGTVMGKYDLPKDIKTGHFSLSLDLTPGIERWGNKGYANFQVEYYQKPEHFIDIEIGKNEYIAGDKSFFTISGEYFFGQPLAGKKIDYTVRSADFYDYYYYTDRSFRSLRDDYRYGYWGGKTIVEGVVDLGDQGEARVDLDLKIPEDTSKSQVYSIQAVLVDEGGQTSLARKNIVVYSGEFGIYRKKYTAGRVNEKATVSLILAPRQSASVSNVALKAKLTRSTWVKYQDPDKKYPSYKEEKEDLPELSAVSNVNGEVQFKFTPSKKGSYKLLVEAIDERGNKVKNTFSVWVIAAGQALYRGSGASGISIQTDKEQYSFEDNAKFTISSDIPNRDVFLSFDRARANRWQVVSLNGNSASISVPLEKTDMPNIFVKVASFSDYHLDTDSTNLLVSAEPMRLKVDIYPDKDKYGPGEMVTINLETKDYAGNPVSANTAFWSVDKALFELADQKPLEIFKTFWKQRYDGTEQAHSLQGINVMEAAEMGGGCFAKDVSILMSDSSQKNIKDVRVGDRVLTRKSINDSQLIEAKVGGVHEAVVDGYFIINHQLKVTPNHRVFVNDKWDEVININIGDNLLNQSGSDVLVESLEWQRGKFTVYNLEIEKYHSFIAAGVWVHNEKGASRTVFKDTAYWNPSLQTDSSGRAQVKFKLPDNVTTWVLASVASTKDTRVGKNTLEIMASKDVIVSPILPNILRIDDKTIISALVRNYTNNDHSFNVSLDFDSGELNSSDHENVSIKAGDFEQLYWEIIPKDKNDQAKLSIKAVGADDKNLGDMVVNKIPVQKFGFWEKRGESAIGSKDYQLKLSDKIDKSESQVSLSLSATMLGSLPSAMRYLVKYPYGCVEQTTSRFVPAVIAKANPDIFSNSIDDKNIDEILTKGVELLLKNQSDGGGWSWWSRGKDDAFITSYVVEYLLQAKNLGVKVNDDLLENVRQFLKQDGIYNYDNNKWEPWDENEEVARIYTLSLLGDDMGKKKLSQFDKYTPNILALAIINNVRNGYNDPNENGLNKLLGMKKSQGDVYYWPEGEGKRFGSKDASTAMAIRAIVAANGDKQVAAQAVNYLMRNRKYDYWSNTFATAQVVQAAVDYSKDLESGANYSYKVLLDGEMIAQGSVQDYRKPLEEIIIKAEDIKEKGSEVSVLKTEGTGQLYSTVLTEEFHNDNKAKAQNNGLTVSRKYINEKGEDYNIGVGDVIKVEIKVGGLNARERYAVISDELPAGMAPINPVFKNTAEKKINYGYHMYGRSGSEYTQNGMVLSLDSINPGTYTYTYRARVVAEGEYSAPPSVAALMYAPEVYGRSDAELIKIKKKSQLGPKTAKDIVGQVKASGNKMIIILAGAGASLISALIAIALKKGIIHLPKLKGKTLPPSLPPDMPDNHE